VATLPEGGSTATGIVMGVGGTVMIVLAGVAGVEAAAAAAAAACTVAATKDGTVGRVGAVVWANAERAMAREASTRVRRRAWAGVFIEKKKGSAGSVVE